MPPVMSRPVQPVQRQEGSCASNGSTWRDVASAGLLRLARPFEELAQDLCEGAASLIPSMETPGIQPSASGAAPSGQDMALPSSWLHDTKNVSLLLLDRAAVPLLELSEDAGHGGALALLAVAGPGASAAAGGKALIALCGLSVQTKGLYTLFGFAMIGGAWSMWNRHPAEADRTVQQRSAIALACSGMMHFVLALGQGIIPPPLAIHMVSPDVVARFLPDVIITPLIIMNVGYIAGKKADQMAPTMVFGVLSALSFATAAAVTQDEAIPLLATGVVCMFKSAYDINRVLPVYAGSIAAVNKLRTQISADLMVFTWIGFPLVEALGMADCISLPMQLHAYVLLDILGKLGVCHIVLRSQEAFLNAQRALSDEHRIPSAR